MLSKNKDACFGNSMWCDERVEICSDGTGKRKYVSLPADRESNRETLCGGAPYASKPINRYTAMEPMYKQQAEPGKQCQDCQSFTINPTNPAAGTCFGKDVVAQGGCMFFKKKEDEQK